MTTEKPFTNEELDEIVTALETHLDHLSKLYRNTEHANGDWRERARMLRDLRTRFIAMKA